jgi:hypothetical protein
MPKGAPPGIRYGGRQKGTPNRITQDVAQSLDEFGCNPLELSAKIAMGQELEGPHPSLKQFRKLARELQTLATTNTVPRFAGLVLALSELIEEELTKGHVPIELRSKHIVDLTQYILPKRKAIEHSGPDGQPMEHTLDTAQLSEETLRAILAAKLSEKVPDKQDASD